MSEQTRETGEWIELLDRKLGMLKREYDQYFLGTRPRPPTLMRSEVQKAVAILSNSAIPNTAMRFKYNSLCSRYQAFKRQWDDTLRKIEEGTYERHRFKANLRAKPCAPPPSRKSRNRDSGPDLYQEYVDARLACGQDNQGISREKLEKSLAQQRQQLKQKFGDDANFQFRVAVENGKVRLKAKREQPDS